MVKVLRRIAGELGTDSVSRPEFLRRIGLSERKVQRLFGSYNGLVEAAGLISRSFPSTEAPTYSNEDMIEEIVRVLRLPNSKLTTIFFDQNSRMSLSACQRRFGGWINALKAAAEKLDPERDSVLLSRIREYTAPEIRVTTRTPPAAHANVALPDTDDEEALEASANEHEIPFVQGNVYGDFINFRGLQHAPVNEQGVVFLFGMICRELGYVVEIVKPGFPDCEAADASRYLAACAD